MPKVTLKSGVSLHYEEHGSGQPLLLLPGFGYWHWCWFKQIPFLQEHFRVIALDHRGVGGSDVPADGYTLPGMAADAAAALGLLGIERAHVLGTSMGGFVAQELALNHPEKVNGLVLVCTAYTAPLKPDFVAGPPAILSLLAPDPSLTPEGNLRRALPGGAVPGYYESHAEDREWIIAERLKLPVPPQVGTAQAMAQYNWPGTKDRLAALECPTLVIHGAEDGLVPAQNGRNLAAAIPGAELTILPGCAHHLFIEQAPMFNRVVTQFLQGVS